MRTAATLLHCCHHLDRRERILSCGFQIQKVWPSSCASSVAPVPDVFLQTLPPRRQRAGINPTNTNTNTNTLLHTVDSAHGIAANKVDVRQEDTTWNEVYQACCVHSAMEWVHATVLLLLLVLLIYLFLVGLDLLGTAFKVVGGSTLFLIYKMFLYSNFLCSCPFVGTCTVL
jgi:hypothetical protein